MLKLNVGLSRKVGEANYGSLGASCSVDVELESSLLFNDLDAFHQRVQQAYIACAQAVNDELARQQSNQPTAVAAEPSVNQALQPENGNGHNGSTGNRASEKQLGYIRQLAGQIKGLGVRRLDTLASNVVGKPMAGLSSFDASSLIDTLKAIKEGRLDVNAALNGAEA